MPQLHCYLQEDLAKKLQEKARHAHLSTSKYLALLVEREVETQWPENYFEIFGSWQGESLERADQGGYETRLELE